MDFVITELGQPVDAIQVCYCDLESKETHDREVSAMIECLEALNLPSGKILTLSFEHRNEINGREIHFIPLYQWFNE